MLFKGIQLTPPKSEPFCIPHENAPDGYVPFVISPVLDPSPFTTKFPTPTPTKKILVAGIGEVLDEKDPNYRKAIAEYWDALEDWIVIESIKSTPDLEFQLINYDDFRTFKNWRKELLDAGFSLPHINQLKATCMRKACISPQLIEEATQNFTRLRR